MKKKQSPPTKQKKTLVMSLCPTQLEAVFSLCDTDSKGFISAQDLVRITETHGQDGSSLQQILSALDLRSSEDRLDFQAFCSRVLSFVQSSPVKNDSLASSSVGSVDSSSGETFEGEGEESGEGMAWNFDRSFTIPTVRRRLSLSSRDNLISHTAPVPIFNCDSPTSEDFHRAIRRMQRQMEEMKEAQLDTKGEILEVIHKNAERQEEELNKRTLSMGKLAEEALEAEKKHLEQALAAEEKANANRIEMLAMEKQGLRAEVGRLNDKVNEMQESAAAKDQECQKVRSANQALQEQMRELQERFELQVAENAELRVSCEVWSERTRNLEEKMASEAQRVSNLKAEVDAERERLDEQRLEMAFDKARVAREREEIILEIKNLSNTVSNLMNGAKVSQKDIKRHLDCSLDEIRTDVDVAVEMFEHETEAMESLEHLMTENNSLKNNLKEVMKEKKALASDLQAVRDERDNLKSQLSAIQESKSEQSQSIIQQFHQALSNSKQRAKVKDLESKLRDEKEKRTALEKNNACERAALEVALKSSREELRKKLSELTELKEELTEAQTELACVKDAAGMIEKNEEERDCLSILVDDLRLQGKEILERVVHIETKMDTMEDKENKRSCLAKDCSNEKVLRARAVPCYLHSNQ